jgi:hypothetical protein
MSESFNIAMIGWLMCGGCPILFAMFGIPLLFSKNDWVYVGAGFIGFAVMWGLVAFRYFSKIYKKTLEKENHKNVG